MATNGKDGRINIPANDPKESNEKDREINTPENGPKGSIDKEKGKEIEERISGESEPEGEIRVGETGRRHPTLHPPTGGAGRGSSQDPGSEYDNHSREEGLFNSGGTNKGSHNNQFLHNPDQQD